MAVSNTMKSDNVRAHSSSTEVPQPELFSASLKNDAGPKTAGKRQRTVSRFHKQLKLMLYPQTCVPFCKSQQGDYPH